MAVAADARFSAAQAALKRQLRLAHQGRSMLYPFIGRSTRFEAWEHYPRHDAIDVTGRWQFYFHAHDSADRHGARHPRERGHIHLFRRDPQGRLAHLAGLSLDAQGLPLCWFATNQWVTGGRWQAAGPLARGLDDIELRLHGPLAGAGLWLADLVRFYADPLRRMLHRRDEALARRCRRLGQSRAQARADRRLAVWSSVPVHWPQDALRAHSGQSYQPRRNP